MMSIEEALAQAELISDDENWVRIEKYPYKSFYEDEEETFIDVEKREISDPSKNVSTLGENNSQLITFVMDRYADGVDLVDMLIQIQYKLQSGEEATAGPVNVYASDDKIKFGWAISNIQTQAVQTIQFIVYCTGKLADGESYLLKTKPMSYRIENTLGTGGYIEKPSDEWFLQFEETMNQKMNQVATLTNSAIDSAAGAKESEQNAAQSASTASTLAGQVQSNTAQAKASADAAKVSEQNAKKSEDAARVYAGNASAVANVQIGTSDTAGLLRGGDIHVDESGALKMITTTTETTMPNSHEGRLFVEEIGGVCEQVTTNGNNLIDISYTVTGYKLPIPLEAGTYTLSFKTTASTGGFRLSNSTDTSANSVVMTGGASNGYVVLSLTTNFVSNYINISSDSGTISEVMLNKGGTALPYEPYTGGQPAPNPSYPQEIKKSVVSGVKTHGKNHMGLRVFDSDIREVKGITYTFVRDNSGYLKYINANGTADGASTLAISLSANMKLTVGESYILSGCPSGGGLNSYRMHFYNINGSGSFIYDLGAGQQFVFSNETDDYNVAININSGVTVNNLKFYPMIRKADIADATYEPYKESSVILSNPIELNGIGDLQDVIEGSKVKRRFGGIILKGNEAWKLSGNGNWYYFNLVGGSTNLKSKVASTHFKSGVWVTKASNTICLGNNDVATLGISADSFATVDDFKTFLTSNEVKVIYELANEITEDLPLADQIALNSLATYDGITYLEFVSEIKPTFEGKYGTSEVGGYTLEGMLTARNADLKVTAAQSTNEEV